MATPQVSPFTFADLRTPLSVAVNKTNLYNQLSANGFTAALSWEDTSVPSALVEIDADALTNFQQATQAVLYSGFSEWATGDALAEHSRQVYNNQKRTGTRAIMRVRLTDGGAGPFTIDPTAISVSVGDGGLTFDGVLDPTGATGNQINLPLNGSASIYVQATAVGAAYNVAAGTIDTLARGVLPGVSVTNPPDALSAPGSVQGADVEKDDALRARNRTQWGTLGMGSPPIAYENWVRGADVSITRVAVYTNVDMLDPGTVTILIAGSAGALGPTAVLAAQNAVAPATIGGSKIPETARAIVASAVNNVVPVIANLYVQAEYNTTAFHLLVFDAVDAFESALVIGGKISWARLQEVVLSPAGTSAGIITDADWLSPLTDQIQAYYQVAIFDLTQLVFISV